MKRKITISLMALGLALPVINLQAQEDARPPRGPRGEGRGERPGPAFLMALDANKDGKLDKGEIAASSDVLKTLDKDSDGKLTVAELRGAAGRGPRGEGQRPPRDADHPQRPDAQQGEDGAGAPRPNLPPLIAALDSNKSGAIDTDELAIAPAALLKLDKNNDGELTADEMRGGRGGSDRPRREGRGPRPEDKPQ